MIRIGMRLTLNTRKVGRRRVGNGMRMILSIGHSRNSVVGNLHRIIRIIGKSGGCICKSGENGRRRKGNSYQFSVFSGESGIGLTKPSHKEKVLLQEKALPQEIYLFSCQLTPLTPLIRGAFVVSFQGVRLGNLASKK